jgi:hypothetical protein
MAFSTTAEAISVAVVDVTSRGKPPSTQLLFEVRNDSTAPIWLVDEWWPIWSRTGTDIELSYKRGRMQPGAQVFGYFTPEVIMIEPSQGLSRTVEHTWPQPLDRLWNDVEWAASPPGEVRVRVRLGYGRTSEPKPPRSGEGVEGPVLRWQREVVSPAVSMVVPSYQSLSGEPDGTPEPPEGRSKQ